MAKKLIEYPDDTPTDTIRKLRCHLMYVEQCLIRTEANLARANSQIRKHNAQVEKDNSLFARVFGKF